MRYPRDRPVAFAIATRKWCVLEPDRLRLLKNRDSDYLAILAAFQDYQLSFFTKNNLFLRLLLDYQLPISGNVIGNRDYQLLILSNRSSSTQCLSKQIANAT